MAKPYSMGQEIALFLRFIIRPKPAPRLQGRSLGHNIWCDFALNTSVWRLLQWAVLLWLVNLFIFAPMALSAAQASGAQHRLDIHNLPWLTAFIWAPLVEELCFRYVLRRPAMLWWFVPLMVAILLQGPGITQSLLLCLAFLLALAPLWFRDHKLAWLWRASDRTKYWCLRLYPLFFHLVGILFAAVHLFNFKFASLPLVLLPLLVIPQWVTGLVLGWLRVSRGIGASIVLHAIFNGGPLLLIGLVLHFAPELAVNSLLFTKPQ